MSWEEFFCKYRDAIANSLFFAFQGEFEYSGIVHAVRDHFPLSQNVRIIIKDVRCRKFEETREWTHIGRSACTILRRMTCFEEIQRGVFSLQLDDTHHAFIILENAEHQIMLAKK